MQNHPGAEMKPRGRSDATTTGMAPEAWLPVALGLLSVVLFWLPLLAPLIQIAAVMESMRVARVGVAGKWSLSVGLGGALIGFALLLAMEFRWII